MIDSSGVSVILVGFVWVSVYKYNEMSYMFIEKYGLSSETCLVKR